MTTAKYLGIWMDHTSANLMEFSKDQIETKIIVSKFSHEEKEEIMRKGELHMHNKEQHEQAGYYSQLAEVMKNYEEVLLFGPTDAKTELFNSLKGDKKFSAIKIEIKQADKMTENQQHAYVKEYFSTRIAGTKKPVHFHN
jgi:hypothetical protein